MEYISRQQPTGDLRGRKQKDLPAAAVKFGWASHLQKPERPSPEKKTMQIKLRKKNTVVGLETIPSGND